MWISSRILTTSTRCVRQPVEHLTLVGQIHRVAPDEAHARPHLGGLFLGEHTREGENDQVLPVTANSVFVLHGSLLTGR